ncbi:MULTISPECIES: hypothetical protein [unclassified Nostoc]|uniref:hypothetical protein n=1 Tax=unclassified Nostoc TaxID=2593658 RepID=UPI00262C8258|nr:hypothetical protein [Nostoc sp. S13]MDF5736805.1 hypothetical protein [Nostoc sp. S13]
MKFDLGFAGFALSLIVAASGWFFRWSDKQKFEKQQSNLERQQAIQQAAAATEKRVNEERDFNHLRNNQIQISSGIASGFKDIEHQLDNIHQEQIHKLNDIYQEQIEMKAYLIRNQNTPRGE